MTSEDAKLGDGGRRDAVLLFDSAGRLAAWNAAAASLPGADGLLQPGIADGALAPLFAAADALGLAVTDWPLADGGRVRRLSAVGEAADPSGRLFAAASHDLRQPLAALALLIGVLEGRLDGPRTPGVADHAARDLLKAMDNAVQTMKGMVDGHFDLTRLDAGLLQPDPGNHVVNGILMRIALDAAPRFERRGLRFSVLPCSAVVRTDASLLERLLQGFVANTLRHTDRGRVVLGCRRHGPDLRIELWDTGRGRSPERLRALYEDLHRSGGGPVGGPGGGPAGGSGGGDLELRLAGGLARRLGHRLEVRTVEGGGTMLAVLVPRAPEGKAALGASLPEPVSTDNAGDNAAEGPGTDVERARVLVIEDNPMVLDALGALLGQWGCAVIGAESYDAALDRLGPAPQAPHLVIADLRLKGAANGIVAIRQLAKTLESDLPGLILTGDTDPMRLREARLSGYSLLHKPVAPLALRAAVTRLLGRGLLKV